MTRVPVADDVDHEPTTIGGVNAIDVAIRGIESAGTILYFHGGVYVIGTAAATVPLVSDLARRAHAKAVTVDYRLGPEHPYPAAVDDARAIYQGLLAQGLDAGQKSLSPANRPEVGWRSPHSSP
jgi:acetyl esterase/lipase